MHPPLLLFPNFQMALRDMCYDGKIIIARSQGNRGPFVMETVKADDKAKLGEYFVNWNVVVSMLMRRVICRCLLYIISLIVRNWDSDQFYC